MPPPTELPIVPVKHPDFISYVAERPNEPIAQLLEPFKQYDAKLREVFAQEPDHPAITDAHLNIVPVFAGHEQDVKIRARDIESETVEERQRYVMPLKSDDRRANGSPAIVPNIKEFQHNFTLFSESSLVDMDWSNVVAAGSAVVTCMLPVPEKHKGSKRALREYYHDQIAPASDVDLFLHGLSEQEAINKIIQIEKTIKDSILTETTTIRTKSAITIASQYPTRHIQIVLRVYKSVAEILTGFDVDCSCAAYNGKQVYAAPRALSAYMTQTNTIDLTRRSPSYENRLSKYSHRGFEVYWPLLDRSRVDPTIFERNFGRTVGLARLLVLEHLPSKSERESYMDERRRERGRPPVNRYQFTEMPGNIKEEHEDEVAEWVEEEDVSNYHTFTIPYGKKYYARKIEKLLYAKDLLLNAEWNKKKEREVNLHRHPAFFGNTEDVIEDCCGFCPAPVSPEEHDVAEEEAKIYVSGKISFIKDDPGRQAIGSFNPITDDDWTEMAYVGNTARLCQAIVDHDSEHVEDWLSQDGADPNCRDYTGRAPLHLAVMSSTPAIVKALIDHGARLVARLADGRTALHLAAARGNVEMIKMIMNQSEQNEEEEAKKEETRKQARQSARAQKNAAMDIDGDDKVRKGDSDIEMLEDDFVENDSDEDMESATTGSFVKVQDENRNQEEADVLDDENTDDADVYDINVLAWDTQLSPLHYAILNGHIDAVKELVQTFGADVLLPVKLVSRSTWSPEGAILNLVLCLRLSFEKATAMMQALLELGASSAQADMDQKTALQYISEARPELLHTLFEYDEPAARRAINHISVPGSSYYSCNAQSPLMSVIEQENENAAFKLLELGASPTIRFQEWIKSVETKHKEFKERSPERNWEEFLEDVEQPICSAVEFELPELAMLLLEKESDPNTLPKDTAKYLENEHHWKNYKMYSLLDRVRRKIKKLREWKPDSPPEQPKIRFNPNTDYFKDVEKGTYEFFIAKTEVERRQQEDEQQQESYEKQMERHRKRKGMAEKQEKITEMIKKYTELERRLVSRGAKTFYEMHPDKKKQKKQKKELIEPESPSWRSSKAETEWWWSVAFDAYDLTSETRTAHREMFEAAWSGDLDKIKSLTLAPWGPDKDQMPLRIAVGDSVEMSPFSIAILRGHYDLAREIVQIAFLQYRPEDKAVAKHRLRTGNESDDDSSDSDDASLGFHISGEIVDDNYTIDNIGEVANQVNSKISPITFMSWDVPAQSYARHCVGDSTFSYGLDKTEITLSDSMDLFEWALIRNDMEMFKVLLELKVEWSDLLADKEDEDYSAIVELPSNLFALAIKYGRLDILAEVIKHTGAGMEVGMLVKKSGVPYFEKPKYYQGLSVHGQKRDDWVNAARGIYKSVPGYTTPPLLRAASKGSLTSVEWFLGNAPTRHYESFGRMFSSDKLINHLNEKTEGFDNMVKKWLNEDRDLALHCAVEAQPTPESGKLIEYLIKVMPGAIRRRDRNGHTPLLIAFKRLCIEAAKILIKAGADQTSRDDDGRNILHILIEGFSSYETDIDAFKELLGLIDGRLHAGLLKQRSSPYAERNTPLHTLLHRQYSHQAEMLECLLDFAESAGTNNEHLELLDGSGESPVHYAVKTKTHNWLRIMLRVRPDLINREDSVGRTPYEVAEDAWTAESARATHRRDSRFRSFRRSEGLIGVSEESFLPETGPEYPDTVEAVWRFCASFAKDNPGKRRLVTLLDANEVAKRLASRSSK